MKENNGNNGYNAVDFPCKGSIIISLLIEDWNEWLQFCDGSNYCSALGEMAALILSPSQHDQTMERTFH